MTQYEILQGELRRQSRTWLVTGVAGFIGSNLLEQLLLLDQIVIGLDNFSSGRRRNLDDVRSRVTPVQWGRFRFAEVDICHLSSCRELCAGVDYVLHQAALGSVPRSIEDPLRFHASNVSGFLNVLIAARDSKVQRFVYASSSSIYGDDPTLPKVESRTGRPLSPYAATKLMDEIYAEVFHRCYGLPVIGLRYFNVFGPRQDPEGAYAAVIPKWFAAMTGGDDVLINGDGETSRDFCYIDNVVQANLLAATTTRSDAVNRTYNVACGERTTLVHLHAQICRQVSERFPAAGNRKPTFGPERAGDVRHSLASIEEARDILGYKPVYSLAEGLRLSASWYASDARIRVSD